MKSCIMFTPAPRFFGAAFVTALLLTAGLLSPRPARADGNPDQPNRNPPFSAIYVLGDSLSDTGRTHAVIGIPPPPYFDGRFSNGPLWIEHVAPVLRLDYQPLDNFSWAGANTGRINVFTGLPGIRDELDELLASSSHRLDKKALYIVFGGANDFLRILANGEDPAVVIPEAVDNLRQIVTTLHAAGADNIVVIDLPDIGLTPRARAGGSGAGDGRDVPQHAIQRAA
jgi:phospholipase/lecithinase/hemolysin